MKSRAIRSRLNGIRWYFCRLFQCLQARRIGTKVLKQTFLRDSTTSGTLADTLIGRETVRRFVDSRRSIMLPTKRKVLIPSILSPTVSTESILPLRGRTDRASGTAGVTQQL